MITTAQAATILQVSRSRILKLIAAKCLPAEKLGRGMGDSARRPRTCHRPGRIGYDGSVQHVLFPAISAP